MPAIIPIPAFADNYIRRRARRLPRGRLFEGSPEQMVTSLAKLAGFSGETQTYRGHEYVLANLRFAMAVNPDSAALRDRLRHEQGKRDRGLPTVPPIPADERATNPPSAK